MSRRNARKTNALSVALLVGLLGLAGLATAQAWELDRDASPRIGSTWWVHGFPVPGALRSGLEAIDLRSVPFPREAEVVQLVSHSNRDFAALAEALAAHPGSATTRLIPSPSDWNYSDDVGGILIPREMVRGVVDALAA